MADLKISQLTAITTLTPATDVLPVVDVTGTTKKITTNQILGSGGTATLASATITGDLTVRTSKLAVTSTGVAVGATSAAYPLDVTGIINTNSDAYVQGGRLALYRPAGSSYIDIASGQDLVFRGGLTTVGGAGASDLMRLNSTGLGVGVSPSYKLDIFGTIRVGTTNPLVRLETGTNTGFVDYNDTRLQLHAGPLPIYFVAGNTLKMTLDSSGNVGIGVTPSAGGGCLQLKSGITFPATQVASSDANTLDDYEEGAWTGTLKGSVSDPTTPVTATGRYAKVGRLVTAHIDFGAFNSTGASGNASITGLPFTNGLLSCGSVESGATLTFSGTLAADISTGGTTIQLQSITSNGYAVFATHNAGNPRYLTVTITYTV